MNLKEPIALALVRRPDGLLLTLPGLAKVDLPGTHVKAGASLEGALRGKLLDLGVHAPRLVYRWGALAGYMGNPRPVSVFEAVGWTGTPTEVCDWSAETEITRSVRAELYRRLFAKLREGGRTVAEKGLVVAEDKQEKPRPYPCPKCRSGLIVRPRLKAETRYECRTCSSFWMVVDGAMQQVP